tara:strand:- start:121 stop:477 length:357 start_codon:yes stop_codon:yes gene_type:complete
MSKFLKLLSFIYLTLITIAFLIPLNSPIITILVEKQKQPSNEISFFFHLTLLFLLYLFLYISFSKKNIILLFCIFYSVLIEILQLFTSRGFQFYDIIFNLIGVLISFILLSHYYNKKR